jgi:Ca2+/H+ antiporter
VWIETGLSTVLRRNNRAGVELGSVERRQWTLLVVGALAGFVVIGALVAVVPNGVVSVRTVTGKVVQVSTTDANGSAWAGFVLAIPVLYFGLLQALRVDVSDGFPEAVGVFACGFAIGAVSEPIRHSWLPGAIAGIVMGAVVILVIEFGQRSSSSTGDGS